MGLALAFFLLLTACTAVEQVEPESVSEVAANWTGGKDGSLQSLADSIGFRIGAAVAIKPLRADPAYRKVLSREFNLLTIENNLKFGPVHPEPNRYNFGPIDEILSFAESNGIMVRGHTLVWHHQLPDWLEESEWSRDRLIEVLRSHIRKVMGRYRGRIQVWDVVNEAVSNLWGLRNTIWKNVIGDDYIAIAFKIAHETDPKARLFYNDNRAEGMSAKSGRVYRLLRDLIKDGVPIHGIGLQAHLHLSIPSSEELRTNLRRLAGLGLEIHITEVDVPLLYLGGIIPITEARLQKQGILYRRILDACLSVPECTQFVTWGVTDRYSWIPDHVPGFGSALLFDDQYRPKPAYYAVRDRLSIGMTPRSPIN